MPFTNALYYPWIDIKNESWLKNAMLYWDSIQTIVPSSVRNPYTTRTALEFQGEGLLQPFLVEPSMREIADLTDEVLKYLETPEGISLLFGRDPNFEYLYIHPDKLPSEVRELVEMYPEKLPHAIRRKIENSFDSSQKRNKVNVPTKFAEYYMTLLATHLSNDIGAGLLTDASINSNLANAARYDAAWKIPRKLSWRYADYDQNRDLPTFLAQGLVANMIINNIEIDSGTTVKKIIKFRKEHADEIVRFRREIERLTQSISSSQSLEQLKQTIESIYKELLLSKNDLEKCLTDNKIKWICGNFLTISFFSEGSTAIPLLLLGMSAPYALIASLGISMTVSTILYNRDKQAILRNSPSSFLLGIKEELG